MGAGTKDKMLLIIAARGTERWRAGEWKGRRSERIRKKKSKGIWSANQTLLLWPLISRQRERLGGVVGGVRVREMERKEGKEDGWNKRERHNSERDGMMEREKRKRETEKRKNGAGLHLFTTPGCYRACVLWPVHSPGSHHNTMSCTIQLHSVQQ